MTEKTADTIEPERPWKQSLLLATAIGGGTLVVAGLTAIVVLLNLPAVGALDILPANRTIIAMAGDSPVLKKLQTAAPGLNLPTAGSGQLVALLSLESGQPQWVTLPWNDANPSSPTLPPEVRAILNNGPSLADEPIVAALPSDADFFLFANVPWLRSEGDLHPFLTAILTGRRQVALAARGNRWQLSTDGGPAGDAITRTLPLGLPVSALSFAAGDMAQLIDTVQSWQQPDARLITTGLVRSLLGRTLGPHAFSGAALTALQHTTLASIAPTAGSGAVRIALSLDLPPDSTQSTAKTLTDAFAASLPRTIINRQKLDDEHTIVEARLDDSPLIESESQQGAWTVTSLSHSGSIRRLSLALSSVDRHLYIASDDEGIAGLLPIGNSANSLPILSESDSLMAGGLLRPAVLASILPPSTPALLTRGLITAWPQSPVITWNVTARNGVWSLIIDLL